MAKTAETYHVPVLLKESVNGLHIKPEGIYVDVTFGGGGHSREILSRLGPEGHLYSFDQDADAENNIFEDEQQGCSGMARQPVYVCAFKLQISEKLDALLRHRAH